jgi:hypothetical protein
LVPPVTSAPAAIRLRDHRAVEDGGVVGDQCLGADMGAMDDAHVRHGRSGTYVDRDAGR